MQNFARGWRRRELTYKLEEILAAKNARRHGGGEERRGYILTAHQADDQVCVSMRTRLRVPVCMRTHLFD